MKVFFLHVRRLAGYPNDCRTGTTFFLYPKGGLHGKAQGRGAHPVSGREPDSCTLKGYDRFRLGPSICKR